MFRSKSFFLSLIFFVLLNSILYSFIFFFNNKVAFNKRQYLLSAHHYYVDPRIDNKQFSLLRALGQYDAQIYLKIANSGYPTKALFSLPQTEKYIGSMTYAFSPFYPLLLSFLNFIFHNIELSAFIFANILLLINFLSLYYVISKMYSQTLAIRTIFLLFLFPFSIFYRSYFAEGLFLFLLIWFSYFLIKKNWFLTALCLAALVVTRPNGIPFFLLFFFSLFQAVWRGKITLQKTIIVSLMSIMPFIGWLYFCFRQTGDPWYWFHVQTSWFRSFPLFGPLANNLATILAFAQLPAHGFHESQVDVTVIGLVFLLLILGRWYLKPQLWWISFLLWFVPLVTKDTMSFSRYQIVSFPLFIIASMAPKKYVIGLGITFFLLLFFVSVFFVNWYWVG
ncbi:MAG TPA: hypothetical protein VE090_06050 [Methylomirabilota bacterium]|nr:hypothetical protein [Methylomirabilota bacterium]